MSLKKIKILKISKKIIFTILFFVLFSVCFVKESSAANNKMAAERYANSIFDIVRNTLCIYKNDFDISTDKLRHITLGEAYVICDLDEESQDEIYYFPVLSDNKEVIAILNIAGVSDGWHYSISNELVDILNDIDYVHNRAYFYKNKNSTVVESKNVIHNLLGYSNELVSEIRQKTKKQRESILRQTLNKFHKVKIHDNAKAENLICEYKPSFSESTRDRKICSLHNPQSQGTYPLCWAATVATIVNYCKGTNYSCTDVAKKMGQKPPYHGESDGVAWNALSIYGVAYNNLYFDRSNKMSWDTYKLYINNKYPVYIGAMTSDHKTGHAVTGFGYRTVSLVEYVSIWNSGINNMMAVPFKHSGTTFVYNNKVFVWETSVAAY